MSDKYVVIPLWGHAVCRQSEAAAMEKWYSQNWYKPRGDQERPPHACVEFTYGGDMCADKYAAATEYANWKNSQLPKARLMKGIGSVTVYDSDNCPVAAYYSADRLERAEAHLRELNGE